jgi:TonB family protein
VKKDLLGFGPIFPRISGTKLLQAVVMTAVLAVSPFARAGDERAIKTRIAPVYPEIAKRLHIGGEVKLEAIVDADGKVKDVKPVSGNSMLSAAAQDAVRQWRFVPGSGESSVIVSVNFDASH